MFPINKLMLRPLQLREQILAEHRVAPRRNHLIKKIRITVHHPLLFR